jgi:hypothetical protein
MMFLMIIIMHEIYFVLYIIIIIILILILILILGHGLQTDFETANIYVPPTQIYDTVELWRLPAQRKISLRFLAGYILKRNIQDEGKLL